MGRRGEAPRNQASATFPIRLQSRVSGIFGVYSTQREYFQVAEVEFLEEIAGNVSHALDLSRAKTGSFAMKTQWDYTPPLWSPLTTPLPVLRWTGL